jgi:hypothetical protein
MLTSRQAKGSLKVFPGNSGYVFPLVLFIIIILVMLITTIYTLVLTNHKNTSYWSDKTKALYAAESGLNDALYRLFEKNDQPSEIESDPAIMGPEASYTVQFIPQGVNEIKIAARGTYNGVKNTASLTVYFEGGTTLFPQVAVGMDADPPDFDYYENYGYPEITFELPPVPPGLTPEVFRETIGPGDHWFNQIDMANKERITINGPANIYVTDDFILSNISKLTVNGDVNFYIAGNFLLDNNGQMDLRGTTNWYIDGNVVFDNVTSLTQTDPAYFYITGNLRINQTADIGTEPAAELLFLLTTDTSHSVNIENVANVRAGVFNVTGSVYVGNNAYVEGSLIGAQVDMENNATVVYDESLAGVNAGNIGIGGLWHVKAGSWRME